MTETAVRAAPTAEPDSELAAAIDAARALERWGSARGWVGPDPYDALNARRLPHLARRSPLALRVVTQAVKRSPLNLRPILGIPEGLSAATLAHVISAYARNGFLDAEEAQTKLSRCIERLTALRCADFSEPCWGYHFDVQTRVFFYPRTSPNTIATAFAGLGLLDAYELAGAPNALELAVGAGEFFIRHVPQTQAERGAYFGYLPGDSTPIHNANMLVAALLARLARLTDREDFDDAARAAVEYTVSHQRPDGSWTYGERVDLSWIDGFHTGYVLEALLICRVAGIDDAGMSAAIERGLAFYSAELFREDGAPKYSPAALYPIDVQCSAQGIQTFAVAASTDEGYAGRAERIAEYALADMRRGDGAFIFQRRRLWSNPTPHMRWCEAPMLAALSHLLGP